MSLLVDDRFSALAQGDHVCTVYSDPGEQAEAMVRYMRSGIESGERSVYITDDRACGDIQKRLAADGVDVGAAQAADRLQLLTKRESYLRDGIFSPTGMVDFLKTAEQDALAAGCTGLRVSGEMTWALGSEAGCERVIEYEQELNRFFPGSHSHAICHYNRSKFSPAVIRDVLRTHPIAIIGQQVCPNPFFEPPHLEGEDPKTSWARVDWMIGRLVRLRENEVRLREAIAARDEFLSVASHELRTPLHALNLAVHSLGLTGSTDVEKNRIVRQVQRLNRLVDSTFDFARLRDRQRPLQPEFCNLQSVVEEVVSRFDVEAAHSEAPVCVSVPPVIGFWDKHALDEIVSNLLSNALKYGAGQPIDVTGRRTNGHALVTVRDRGVGIPREHRDRIFDRFARAVSSRSYAGFGLGLWIVRETVTAMGGAVRVVEAEGPGSAFEVSLPIGYDDIPRH